MLPPIYSCLNTTVTVGFHYVPTVLFVLANCIPIFVFRHPLLSMMYMYAFLEMSNFIIDMDMSLIVYTPVTFIVLPL